MSNTNKNVFFQSFLNTSLIIFSLVFIAILFSYYIYSNKEKDLFISEIYHFEEVIKTQEQISYQLDTSKIRFLHRGEYFIAQPIILRSQENNSSIISYESSIYPEYNSENKLISFQVIFKDIRDYNFINQFKEHPIPQLQWLYTLLKKREDRNIQVFIDLESIQEIVYNEPEFDLIEDYSKIQEYIQISYSHF